MELERLYHGRKAFFDLMQAVYEIYPYILCDTKGRLSCDRGDLSQNKNIFLNLILAIYEIYCVYIVYILCIYQKI